MTSRENQQTVAITLMQTKIHCRKHIKCKTAKQRPDKTTTAKSNTQQYKYKQQTTCSQKVNPTEATSQKDREHSIEARQLPHTQRVKGKR